ncbi:MAG: HypC/HybG/HupF family hydrogenase formation chaperone [Acidobacteriota bacterium]|nr:HypC/HybG/HupF family hydrogenase formation chaperone [Acidobacteriota bacterium]OQB57738.1 MAG: Hydrogenase isoenzymes formation protein HypC [Candidatus Aminicenantes bacterium ADurb.Bin147]HNQ81445.1 HypC/HybG/HupF family hydrogenase formation chaperone [Candidatus Aminicenantes bacterium]MDD8011252.1 HypC/HybG/HupF family hydrogenase formation chaperone [Acidobacteriota bacterium]MDD8030090.1 HypC/HybG/HupF family hydrogenase formation chaperone [Acidobacteriota bacterium]
MCLAIPVRVVEIDASGDAGKVDYLGTKIGANFALIRDVRVGDWVIVHAGFAISRLDEAEARETLALLRDVQDAGRS